jgi:hypothetical protein
MHSSTLVGCVVIDKSGVMVTLAVSLNALSHPLPDAVINTLYHKTPRDVDGGVYVAVDEPGPTQVSSYQYPFGLVCQA